MTKDTARIIIAILIGLWGSLVFVLEPGGFPHFAWCLINGMSLMVAILVVVEKLINSAFPRE